MYIVLGNTYQIKDELKEDGARFNRIFGWYFNKPYDKYPTQRIEGKDFLMEFDTGELDINWEKAKNAVDKIKKEYEDSHRQVSKSEWVGEVGEKYNSTVMLKNVYTFISSFTEDLMGIYKFEDRSGNVIVWKTSIRDELEENKLYIISGRIKDHSEFKGEKQRR